jgi:hypothetical protein
MAWIIGLGAGLVATTLALLAQAAFSGPKRGVFVRGRKIHGPGGFTYRIADSDLLWLARAVWGEAGTNERSGAAVIWSMAQYHALVLGRSGRRPKFSSLKNLLRAYCQPINPKWASRGASGCQRRPDHCTERHLRRRRRITTASWEQIPPQVRDLVTRFADGNLGNPVPGMTDWAAYDWSHRAKGGRLVDIGGNLFGVGKDRRMYQEETT